MASKAVEIENTERTQKTEYVKTIEEKSMNETKPSYFPWTTEIAKRAAIRLYATNSETADKAMELLT